jgi:UDP-N-acetylmuramyl pentapeptide phosphotransferase/UDP-N-acetylglucosamine-1-phosphate transferase
VLDVPNARSSHTIPTPRGGGVVLVLVALIGTVAGVALGAVSWRPELLWVGAAALAVAAVSWVEDLHRVPLGVRLAVQAAAAIAAVVALGGPHPIAVPLVGALGPSVSSSVLEVVWIVGLANAFNFMDGIDGIAGGQALVAAVGWMLLAASGSSLQWIAMLLAAGSLGFLFFNSPPAKLFMGDVGAVFMGYTLAVLPLVAGRSEPRIAFAGVLLVWPFLFDTAFTLVRRLAKRENVMAAHRSHLYQRLVIAGWSHTSVSMLYGGLALVGVGMAALWTAGGRSAGAIVTAVIGITAVGLWALTLVVEGASARRNAS